MRGTTFVVHFPILKHADAAAAREEVAAALGRIAGSAGLTVTVGHELAGSIVEDAKKEAAYIRDLAIEDARHEADSTRRHMQTQLVSALAALDTATQAVTRLAKENR